MNTQYCIWHFSAEEVITASGLEYSNFEGASVLDMGCGFSDLLPFIWEHSSPERLVGIDPIFSSPESFQKAQDDTRAYIDELIQSYLFLPKTIDKLQIRRNALEKFSFTQSKVEYQADTSNLEQGSFDYIFLNFVLAHIIDLQVKAKLLSNLRAFKKKVWTLIIIDGGHIVDSVQAWNLKGSTRRISRAVSCLKI